MLVTLLSVAKIIEVTVGWFCTQKLGISPVIVSPTCTPEELKALEVVMGAGGVAAVPLTEIEPSLMPIPMFMIKSCYRLRTFRNRTEPY